MLENINKTFNSAADGTREGLTDNICKNKFNEVVAGVCSHTVLTLFTRSVS